MEIDEKKLKAFIVKEKDYLSDINNYQMGFVSREEREYRLLELKRVCEYLGLDYDKIHS